ncbi:hypothetical protein BT93_L0704 [Corymbia citriodora subsp. variegata]|uniref:PRELI/MSF1 domain-containing protein n=1 Tax=Corymbia citriodora subsp. variegata TaxID=360336 RepID=A0A8T0CEH4_CORYI|nr:hypothetical protein BT93_L0704 [Corymbia citriodora subsp. variegata]
MKIYSSSTEYNYSFPTVTLAYFLRYPNPYSTHVMSTDVLDRHLDPLTNRLHTVRLHLKRSKVPAGILAFLPKDWVGPGGKNSSFVLEKTTVDVKEGWMKTESRNMEWTGVLSVVEQQLYKDMSVAEIGARDKATACKTTVTFVSRFGEKIRRRRKMRAEAREQDAANDDDTTEKQGFFARLKNASVQSTIELLGQKRSAQSVTNGAEGMRVVLSRLREGGIRGVLDGMRHDRMTLMGDDGLWQDVWRQGQSESSKKDSD